MLDEIRNSTTRRARRTAIRREIRALERRIAIARTDMQRDPRRQMRELYQSLLVARDKLNRIRHKRLNAPQLVVQYQDRIAELEGEIEALKHRDGLLKMLRMMRELDPDMQQTSLSRIIEDAALVRDGITEARKLISAYESEIRIVERHAAGGFDEEEQRAEENVHRRVRWMNEFVTNHTEGWRVIDETREQIDELNTEKAVLDCHAELDRLIELVEQTAALTGEPVTSVLERLQAGIGN